MATRLRRIHDPAAAVRPIVRRRRASSQRARTPRKWNKSVVRSARTGPNEPKGATASDLSGRSVVVHPRGHGQVAARAALSRGFETSAGGSAPRTCVGGGPRVAASRRVRVAVPGGVARRLRGGVGGRRLLAGHRTRGAPCSRPADERGGAIGIVRTDHRSSGGAGRSVPTGRAVRAATAAATNLPARAARRARARDGRYAGVDGGRCGGVRRHGRARAVGRLEAQAGRERRIAARHEARAAGRTLPVGGAGRRARRGAPRASVLGAPAARALRAAARTAAAATSHVVAARRGAAARATASAVAARDAARARTAVLAAVARRIAAVLPGGVIDPTASA